VEKIEGMVLERFLWKELSVKTATVIATVL